MKNIRSLLPALLLLLAAGLSAQGIGLRAGVNFQNINGKNAAGDKLENDLVAGFNAGINGEIPIAPDFYFQPGLMFTLKGAKSTGEILGQSVASKLTLGYLEIPVNLVHKPALGSGRLILGFGPYVGFGLTGNAKLESGDNNADLDMEYKNTVEISDPDDVFYFRRFDAGANILAGYEFANGLSFQLNTQLGLVNINPEYQGIADDKSKWNHTGFGASLGYRF